MNIALVDDRQADRLQLEHLLNTYDSIHQLGMVFYHFPDGESLLKEYTPFKYTLVFLDIYMGGLDGIETAERIRKTDDDTLLVFLTTSEEHRPEAFSVFASAYLSKPCSEEAVFRTLDHLFHIHTGEDRLFSFSFDRREYSLSFSNIVSLETDGNYLSITDSSARNYRTRMTFTTAERQLDSRFLTLMKGLIVNMDYISQMLDSQCIMKNGTVFPVHVKRKNDLRQTWLNYKFAKIRENMAGSGEQNHA